MISTGCKDINDVQRVHAADTFRGKESPRRAYPAVVSRSEGWTLRRAPVRGNMADVDLDFDGRGGPGEGDW
jgi:hypothetical protein